MIIGKGGSFIKHLKESSGAFIQLSQKAKDTTLPERVVTVIGEDENNKAALEMILEKVQEDPQSGSCLNISYSDMTGPIANFNPTGSPFANGGSPVADQPCQGESQANNCSGFNLNIPGESQANNCSGFNLNIPGYSCLNIKLNFQSSVPPTDP